MSRINVRGWVLAVPTAVAASAALLPAASAMAAFPGADGAIAFHADRSIYRMEAGSSQPVKLPEDVPGFGGLSLSADGTRIAYSDSHIVYAMNADGTRQRRLSAPDAPFEDNPSFSPDGRQIAYERGYGIWVMNADGSGAHSITPAADFYHEYSEPAWSPDGSRIAYTYKQQVWTMRADGSDQVDLTPPAHICPLSERTMYGSQPDWSPDGRRIAFTGPVTCDNSLGTDIWVMNADGSAKTDLIRDDGTEDRAPAFSPSGTRIAFVRDVNAFAHVFTMPAAGGPVSRLATGLASEDSPGWGAAFATLKVTERARPHAARTGRRVVISGRVVPAEAGKVRVVVKRGHKRVARKTVRLRHSRFRYAYRARRPGRYSASARYVGPVAHLGGQSKPARFRVRRHG